LQFKGNFTELSETQLSISQS